MYVLPTGESQLFDEDSGEEEFDDESINNLPPSQLNNAAEAHIWLHSHAKTPYVLGE